MAIVTVADVHQYLEQLAQLTGEPANAADATLTAIIPRAEDMVQKAVGLTFGAYTSATVKSVLTDATSLLTLPPHQAGSVTVVNAGGSVISPTTYAEDDDGHLYLITDTSWYGYFSPRRNTIEWGSGRYLITANWGIGPAPDSVKQVCLEVAVNLWRGKDRGMWADTIGVDGSGGLRFTGGLTPAQAQILKNVRRAYIPFRMA